MNSIRIRNLEAVGCIVSSLAQECSMLGYEALSINASCVLAESILARSESYDIPIKLSYSREILASSVNPREYSVTISTDMQHDGIQYAAGRSCCTIQANDLLTDLCGRMSFLGLLYSRFATFSVPNGIIPDSCRRKRSEIRWLRYNSQDRMIEAETNCPDEIVECLLMMGGYPNLNVASVNNKIVPIVPLVCSHMERRHKSEFDIANSILPQLESKGVRVLLLDNPDRSAIAQDFIESAKPNLRKSTMDLKPTDEANEELLAFLERDELDPQFVEECISFQTPTIFNGIPLPEPHMGKYFNCTRWERFTPGNPQSWHGRLFLFGPCSIRGHFCDDNHSLGACLRKLTPPEFYIHNGGGFLPSTNIMMRVNQYHAGDTVCLMVYDKSLYRKYTVADLSSAYPKDASLATAAWDRAGHIGPKVTREIAELLYEKCLAVNAFDVRRHRLHIAKKSSDGVIVQSPDNRRGVHCEERKPRNGAMVINCNPFTFGHLKLAEYASKQINHLFVFVVEEDDSEFTFDERYEMAQKALREIRNVTVIPSGKKLASKAVIPGYFSKNRSEFIERDALLDIDVFATEIAPRHNIGVRFVGTEPGCGFTRLFNDSMKKYLPKYDIELVEVQRYAIGGQIVSASEVRDLIRQGNLERALSLVPPSSRQVITESQWVKSMCKSPNYADARNPYEVIFPGCNNLTDMI